VQFVGDGAVVLQVAPARHRQHRTGRDVAGIERKRRHALGACYRRHQLHEGQVALEGGFVVLRVDVDLARLDNFRALLVVTLGAQPKVVAVHTQTVPSS
jgi:hypothetical protein